METAVLMSRVRRWVSLGSLCEFSSRLRCLIPTNDGQISNVNSLSRTGSVQFIYVVHLSM
jgi:hypothetical protein